MSRVWLQPHDGAARLFMIAAAEGMLSPAALLFRAPRGAASTLEGNMNRTVYKTLSDTTIEGLQSQIMRAIEAGWSPAGTYTIDFDDDLTFSQEMAKWGEFSGSAP